MPEEEAHGHKRLASTLPTNMCALPSWWDGSRNSSSLERCLLVPCQPTMHFGARMCHASRHLCRCTLEKSVRPTETSPVIRDLRFCSRCCCKRSGAPWSWLDGVVAGCMLVLSAAWLGTHGVSSEGGGAHSVHAHQQEHECRAPECCHWEAGAQCAALELLHECRAPECCH